MTELATTAAPRKISPLEASSRRLHSSIGASATMSFDDYIKAVGATWPSALLSNETSNHSTTLSLRST